MLNRKEGRLERIRKEKLKKIIGIAKGYLESKVQVGMLTHFPSLAKSFSPTLHTVFIEPTDNCNLRCKMCYRGRKIGFMDYALFTRLIDEITAIGNINLILHLGGESLLHPKFLDMLEYTMTKRDRLKRVGFFTNGTLLSDEVEEKLVHLGVDWVAISLEGLGKINDEIRIGSNYEQIAANIRGLLDKRGSHTKPEVSLALTDSGQAPAAIDELVNAWVNHVDFIRVCEVFNSQLQMITPEKFFSGHKTETFSHCLGPCSNMAIFWNGDVVACCSNINGQGLLGNVTQDGILSVWKGLKYRQLRYNLLTGKPEGLCLSCNTWKIGFKNHKENCGKYQVFYYGMMKQYVETFTS